MIDLRNYHRLSPVPDRLGLSAYARDESLMIRFKASKNGALIATDVAARGLDIPAVDHVIHFNLPRTADAYIHRSGRTARAQNPGFALQIVSPEDRAVQRGLMKSLGRGELTTFL